MAKGDVQVHLTVTTELQAELVKDKVESLRTTSEKKYAVLVHMGGKAGLSVSNVFSSKVVERACALAQATAPGDYYYGLPGKKAAKKPLLYDKKVAHMTENDLLAMAEEMIAAMPAGVSLSSGSVSCEVGEECILTSEGVAVHTRETAIEAVAECIARKDGLVSSAWDYRQERKPFAVTPFASSIGEKTKLFLNAQPLREKIPTVILKPQPFSELLDNAFLPNLNGKNVEKQKSCLAGKIGQEIISPSLSMTDDGQLPYGLRSGSIDLEGTPTRKTPLFTKGVLKNFIYDHNTAVHAGTASTGNAGLSSIDFSNVVVTGGYEQVDRALVIDSIIGAHTADELSTDFSVNVDRAYILDAGEKIPVQGFMLSGKMLDVLRQAVSLGKDRETRNGIVTGALATHGVNVILGSH